MTVRHGDGVASDYSEQLLLDREFVVDNGIIAGLSLVHSCLNSCSDQFQTMMVVLVVSMATH